ncbi:MAG: hypothetical protein MHM6MM_005090 [Cercozoa sp. M6MM]
MRKGKSKQGTLTPVLRTPSSTPRNSLQNTPSLKQVRFTLPQIKPLPEDEPLEPDVLSDESDTDSDSDYEQEEEQKVEEISESKKRKKELRGKARARANLVFTDRIAETEQQRFAELLDIISHGEVDTVRQRIQQLCAQIENAKKKRNSTKGDNAIEEVKLENEETSAVADKAGVATADTADRNSAKEEDDTVEAGETAPETTTGESDSSIGLESAETGDASSDAKEQTDTLQLRGPKKKRRRSNNPGVFNPLRAEYGEAFHCAVRRLTATDPSDTRELANCREIVQILLETGHVRINEFDGLAAEIAAISQSIPAIAFLFDQGAEFEQNRLRPFQRHWTGPKLPFAECAAFLCARNLPIVIDEPFPGDRPYPEDVGDVVSQQIVELAFDEVVRSQRLRRVRQLHDDMNLGKRLSPHKRVQLCALADEVHSRTATVRIRILHAMLVLCVCVCVCSCDVETSPSSC